jgi:hypothetical protein
VEISNIRNGGKSIRNDVGFGGKFLVITKNNAVLPGFERINFNFGAMQVKIVVGWEYYFTTHCLCFR